MLSTGFFFSAAAAAAGFAAPEEAAPLSCVFMNHFRMSDDCAQENPRNKKLSREPRIKKLGAPEPPRRE